MNIKLVDGNESLMSECVDSLMDSELGKHYFSNKEKSVRAIQEFVDAGNFLVGLDDSAALKGFICYLPCGAFHAFPYIHLFVVARNERKQGVGKRMMQLFEQEMFKKNDKLFLVVADFNCVAYDFYKSIGYECVGQIPSLYVNGTNERLMMKMML